MKATRRSQPYRKGSRSLGPALAAMKRGAPAGMPNPMDVRRATARRARRKRRARVLGR